MKYLFIILFLSCQKESSVPAKAIFYPAENSGTLSVNISIGTPFICSGADNSKTYTGNVATLCISNPGGDMGKPDDLILWAKEGQSYFK